MSVRSGLIGLLAPDETSCRAFEETLADWHDEWTRASNPIARIRVSARGWVSVARLVITTGRVGFVRADTWRVLALPLFVSAALSLLLIPWIWSYGRWPLSFASFAVAVVLLMPQGVATLLAPVAAIGFGTRRERQPNVITTIPMLVAVMVLLVGWVFPASNQMYREYVFSKLSGEPPEVVSNAARVPNALARGTPELSAPELVRLARSGQSDQRRAAISHLSARLALAVSVPVFFVFGIAVRRSLAARTRWGIARWGIARFAAGASAVGVFLLSSLALSLLQRVSPAVASWPESRGLTIWFSSGVLCVAVIVLARAANPEQPANPEPGTQQRTLNPER
jgi:hypothetical protein